MPAIPDDAEVCRLLTNLSGSNMSESPSIAPFQPQEVYQPLQPPSALPPASSFASINTTNQSVATAKRSRSRPTKSCEQCRRKKLKCNRELPCSQCLKGGRDGRLCHFEYGPEVNERNNVVDPGMERGLKRFRIDIEPFREIFMPMGFSRDARQSVELSRTGMYPSSEQRPLAIQPQGAFSSYATYPTPESVPGAGSSASTSARDERTFPTNTLGRIIVKGHGTRYVGNNDRMALLSHFEEVKNFIFGSSKDPEMSGMIQELFAFQKAFYPRHPYCKAKAELSPGRDTLIAEMLKSVPEGYQLGKLESAYVITWETVSRVIHIPTFSKCCAALAEAKSMGLQTLPPNIQEWNLAQVLCVTAIASRLYDSSNKVAMAEKRPEDQVSKDLAMVQKWLEGIHGKGQTNIHLLETRILLLIAHHASLTHPLELWRECGDIVRRSMVLGMHQDPEGSDRMTKFQKEVRRKLWMTVVEMDMRFSLSAGMPTAVSSHLLNTTELLNVDDNELNEEMPEYPLPKPNSIWTDALPQLALSASTRERLDATNLLGGVINIQKDAPRILHHANILEVALKSLPAQFRSSTKAGNISNKRLPRLFTSIMLDISIRRPLLALYQTIALSPISIQYPEAMAGALRNSLAILAHLDALDPAVADLSTVKTRDYLNLFHIIYKTDIMQAAMILCYQIRTFNQISKSPASTSEEEISNDQEHFREGQTKQSLTRVVENTLKSMIQRIGEYGSDLKEVLPLSVLLQSARADGTAAEKKKTMIQGAERVLAVCRQILPGIQDVVNQNSKAFERFQGGHLPHHGHGTLPHATTPEWNPPPVEDPDHALNANSGILPTFDDFNLMPGGDLLFQNFDFGFSDWDLNQSWV